MFMITCEFRYLAIEPRQFIYPDMTQIEFKEKGIRQKVISQWIRFLHLCSFG